MPELYRSFTLQPPDTDILDVIKELESVPGNEELIQKLKEVPKIPRYQRTRTSSSHSRLLTRLIVNHHSFYTLKLRNLHTPIINREPLLHETLIVISHKRQIAPARLHKSFYVFLDAKLN